VTFNEAGYTLPPGARSHTQCILQDLHGNRPEIQQDATPTVHDPANDTLTPTFSASANATPIVQVKLLTPHGRLPTRATKEAAGLNVYSAADISIPPQQTAKIPLDIAIAPPEETNCQLLSRSGLFSRNNVEVKIGTIDRDYNGNIMVVLQNNYKTNPYHVTQGERVAQLILYRIATPPVVQVNEISPTERGTGSFGSTGCGIINDAAPYHDPSALCSDSSTNRNSGHTLPSHNLISNAHCQSATICQVQQHDHLTPIVQQDGIKPYSIWFSADPFHKRLDIDIELNGQHPTLGLITVSNPMHSSRLQLQDMEKGTPSHKISKWRSTLRRSIILSFNNQPITSQADLES